MYTSASGVTRIAYAGALCGIVASAGWGGCADPGMADESTASLEGAPSVDTLGQPLSESMRALAAANASADHDLGLVARVQVGPQELLEFYEPSPGLVVVSGAGAPEEPVITPGLVEESSVNELWHLATTQAAMPSALQEALERAEERRTARGYDGQADERSNKAAPTGAGGGSSDGPSSDDGVIVAPLSGGWCDTSYFSEGYGDCGGGWDFVDCVNDWWHGRWAKHGDAYKMYTNVCPAQGSVLLKVSSDEGFGGSWSVAEDTVRWYHANDHICAHFWDDCPWIKSEVLHAQDNRFHFRFLVLDE